MIEIVVKGKAVRVQERYRAGDSPTSAEAEALNRLIQRNLKEAVEAGRVRTRAEAIAFAHSDSALAIDAELPPLDLDDTVEDL